MNSHSYIDVTETPNTKGSKEQISRLYNRYRFASEFCKDKEVLEVACGAGLGLGYLACYGKRVVGGDLDENVLKFAKKTYKNRNNIELKVMDAHNLPFPDKSFDVVILYEAIYYLREPERFINEAKRVLREDGILLICTVNKDWAGFNPSPYSYRYFSAPELYSLLTEKGFRVELFADCPVCSGGFKERFLTLVKQTAVKLHLIPKTMKSKEKLKRIFMGKLIPIPPEIDDRMAEYTPPVPIPHDIPNRQHKVLFAVGCVKS